MGSPARLNAPGANWPMSRPFVEETRGQRPDMAPIDLSDSEGEETAPSKRVAAGQPPSPLAGPPQPKNREPRAQLQVSPALKDTFDRLYALDAALSGNTDDLPPAEVKRQERLFGSLTVRAFTHPERPHFYCGDERLALRGLEVFAYDQAGHNPIFKQFALALSSNLNTCPDCVAAQHRLWSAFHTENASRFKMETILSFVRRLKRMNATRLAQWIPHYSTMSSRQRQLLWQQLVVLEPTLLTTVEINSALVGLFNSAVTPPPDLLPDLPPYASLVGVLSSTPSDSRHSLFGKRARCCSAFMNTSLYERCCFATWPCCIPLTTRSPCFRM